jgi:hypothetical protein
VLFAPKKYKERQKGQTKVKTSQKRSKGHKVKIVKKVKIVQKYEKNKKKN